MSNTGCHVQKYRVKMSKVEQVREQIKGWMAFYRYLYRPNNDYVTGVIDGLQGALRIIDKTFEDE